MGFDFSELVEEERVAFLEGEANWEVIKFEDKNSSNGNPMRVLTVKLWDRNGTEVTTICNLVKTNKTLWILKSYCLSAGKEDWWEVRTLGNSEGTCGKCIAGFEPYVNKEGIAKKKIAIKEFLPRVAQNDKSFDFKETAKSSAPADNVPPFPDEDIPF